MSCLWVSLSGPFHEFTPPYTTISFSRLINLYGIITTKELHYKLPIIFLLDWTDLACLKFHYVLILGEVLSHVLLRRFWLQWIYGTYKMNFEVYPMNPLPIHSHCKEVFVEQLYASFPIWVQQVFILFLDCSDTNQRWMDRNYKCSILGWIFSPFVHISIKSMKNSY